MAGPSDQKDLEYTLKVRDESSKALESISRKLTEIDRRYETIGGTSQAASKTTTTATTSMAQGFVHVETRVAKLGPSIGLASKAMTAFGATANPVLNAVTQSAAAVLSAGFNPLGISIGIAAAALSTFGDKANDAELKVKSLADELKRMRIVAEDLELGGGATAAEQRDLARQLSEAYDMPEQSSGWSGEMSPREQAIRAVQDKMAAFDRAQRARQRDIERARPFDPAGAVQPWSPDTDSMDPRTDADRRGAIADRYAAQRRYQENLRAQLEAAPLLEMARQRELEAEERDRALMGEPATPSYRDDTPAERAIARQQERQRQAAAEAERIAGERAQTILSIERDAAERSSDLTRDLTQRHEAAIETRYAEQIEALRSKNATEEELARVHAARLRDLDAARAEGSTLSGRRAYATDAERRVFDDPNAGFGAGVEARVATMSASLQSAAEVGALAADRLGSSMTTAFSQIAIGSVTAGQAFRNFGMSILRTAAEVMTQRAVTQLLGVAFGAASAGTSTAKTAASSASKAGPDAIWLGSLGTYADGGIVSRPEVALVGEAGPEAVIPLKSGRVPVEMRGGGGGGQRIQIVQNLSIHGNPDRAQVAATSKAMRAAAKDAIRQAMTNDSGFRQRVRSVR